MTPENIWPAIRKALRKRDCICVHVRLPNATAEVLTIEGDELWGKDMLIQIRVHKQGWDWLQTFDSVTDAKEALNAEYHR